MTSWKQARDSARARRRPWVAPLELVLAWKAWRRWRRNKQRTRLGMPVR